MLLRIFTIIALLIFLILMFSGSSVEPAMIKSATVFIVLVVGTRISLYFLNIIRESSTSTSTKNKESSPSHN